jgi:hypothetical protein
MGADQGAESGSGPVFAGFCGRPERIDSRGRLCRSKGDQGGKFLADRPDRLEGARPFAHLDFKALDGNVPIVGHSENGRLEKEK